MIFDKSFERNILKMLATIVIASLLIGMSLSGLVMWVIG